jgi:hypothetical protein
MLPMPYRFRFSLGQLMGVIALSALLTANAIFISRGNFTFYSLIGAGLSCAGLGVLFYNRRLSGWIWVWIAGLAGPLLFWAGQAMAFVLLPSPQYSNNTYLNSLAGSWDAIIHAALSRAYVCRPRWLRALR